MLFQLETDKNHYFLYIRHQKAIFGEKNHHMVIIRAYHFLRSAEPTVLFMHDHNNNYSLNLKNTTSRTTHREVTLAKLLNTFTLSFYTHNNQIFSGLNEILFIGKITPSDYTFISS